MVSVSSQNRVTVSDRINRVHFAKILNSFHIWFTEDKTIYISPDSGETVLNMLRSLTSEG